MAETSRYCKAYLLHQLRAFPGWHENSENVRTDSIEEDGVEKEHQRELTDNDFLYVHENYVVTDGIFHDENVIFDDVSDEWIAYCRQELEFAVPDYLQESGASEAAEEPAAAASRDS